MKEYTIYKNNSPFANLIAMNDIEESFEDWLENNSIEVSDFYYHNDKLSAKINDDVYSIE